MLNQLQEHVFDFIVQESLDAGRRFSNGESVVDQIRVAAAYAFALYEDLSVTGKPIVFSQSMLSNRGVPPTDPEFFRNLPALQDFVGLVQALP